MPLNVVVNEVKGPLRTIAIEGDRWKRVVVVVDPKDSIGFDYLDGDPNKLLVTITPAPAEEQK